MNEKKRTGEELVTEAFRQKDLEKKQQVYTDIAAKYYGDPDFKAKADTDPTTTLKEAGLEVPEGAEVKLAFNTPKLIHIVLPPRSVLK